MDDLYVVDVVAEAGSAQHGICAVCGQTVETGASGDAAGDLAFVKDPADTVSFVPLFVHRLCGRGLPAANTLAAARALTVSSDGGTAEEAARTAVRSAVRWWTGISAGVDGSSDGGTAEEAARTAVRSAVRWWTGIDPDA